MNIIGKIVFGILAVAVPVGIYRFSPTLAIALGILIACFVFLGTLMDRVNEANNFTFSNAFKWR